MTPRKYFDRFMLDNEHGRHLKLMRLTDAEYRAFIGGVMAIASKAEIRGAFMVGGAPATAEDVCHQSPKTSRKAAESCLRKLREMRMLEHDDTLGGEWVHDFDEYNPAPKSDPTNAKRQAEWRARNAASNGDRNDESNGESGTRNGDVTPPEVEGEEEHPPKPPQGGNVVKFGRKPVPKTRLEIAERLLSFFNDKAGTSYPAFTGSGKLSDPFRRIVGALTEAAPELSEDEARRIIEYGLAHPYWDGPATPGNVIGPGVLERNRAAIASNGQTTDLSAWVGK